MNKVFKSLVILFVSIVFSINVNATNTNAQYKPQNNVYDDGSNEGNFLSFGHIPSSGKGIKNATWMLDIDFEKIRNKKTIQMLKLQNSNFFQYPLNISVAHPELASVHLYGSGLKKDINIVMFGDFSDLLRIDKIIENLFNKSVVSALSDEKSKIFKKGQIYSLSIYDKKSKEKPQKLYLGLLNKNFITISYQSSEVRYWLTSPLVPWSLSNLSIFNKDNIMQFILNVKPTVKNLKKTNKNSNYLYQSMVLKQTDNIHATVSQKDGKLYFGALLTAKTTKVAKQIARIIDGIIAINTMSNDGNGQLIHSLLLNTVNLAEKNFVRFGTSISLDVLSKSLSENK